MSFENIEIENLTQTELATLLQMLFTNLNNLDKTYYDMFYNVNPMTINLQRYDENGVLQTYQVPNRASDKIGITIGNGDPNGAVQAEQGAFYLDSVAGDLYFKNSDSGSSGWVKVRSDLTFVSGTDYLAPDGDGGNLTGLNGSNISGGVVKTSVGGTGNTSYTDKNLLKAVNVGTESAPLYQFMSAIPDSSYDGSAQTPVTSTDYIRPDELVGQLAYFALSTAPTGWLVCDGTAVSSTVYPRLYSKIGTRFNTGGEASGMFRVPDLRGYFLRAWDNLGTVDPSRSNMSKQDSGAPQHTHGAGTLATSSAGGHTHSRGTMEITGSIYAGSGVNYEGTSGAFYGINNQFGQDYNRDGTGYCGAGFQASRSWSGSTSSAGAHTHTISGNTDNASDSRYQSISEVRPYNFAALLCIKY